MIGFITDKANAEKITQEICDAQTRRGLDVFWTLIGMPIFNGQFAGSYFIPADDQIMTTPLLGNPPLTPKDFPEFEGIVESLGGLTARVEIELSDITAPA